MRRQAWMAKTPVLIVMAILLVVACQPKTVIVEKETEEVITQVVEVEKEVTKIVTETRVVEEVTETPVPTYQLEKVTFVIPNLGSFAVDTLNGLIADFEAENPEVKVVLEVLP